MPFGRSHEGFVFVLGRESVDEQRNDCSAARRFRVGFAKVFTSSVAEWKTSERGHAGKLSLKLSEVGLMPARLVRSPEDLERELPSA